MNDTDTQTTIVRPSWLTEPCPAWCDGPHYEQDHPDDRVHFSQDAEVPLSLEQVVKISDDNWALEVMLADLRQGYREAGATVSLGKGEEVRTKLTLDESRSLGETLIRFADQGAEARR